jgi:hypothetical protein
MVGSVVVATCVVFGTTGGIVVGSVVVAACVVFGTTRGTCWVAIGWVVVWVAVG